MWLGLALAAGVSLAGWFAGNVANIAWPYTVAAIAGFASIAFFASSCIKRLLFKSTDWKNYD
jgi:hypothetical protein